MLTGKCLGKEFLTSMMELWVKNMLKKTKHFFEEYRKLSAEEKWKFKFAKEYESDEELVTRFMTFLREIAVSYQNKTVPVITHGGNLRTLLIYNWV